MGGKGPANTARAAEGPPFPGSRSPGLRKSEKGDIAMIYKEFQDLKLSALGMGCMRLPGLTGADAQVD